MSTGTVSVLMSNELVSLAGALSRLEQCVLWKLDPADLPGAAWAKRIMIFMQHVLCRSWNMRSSRLADGVSEWWSLGLAIAARCIQV